MLSCLRWCIYDRKSRDLVRRRVKEVSSKRGGNGRRLREKNGVVVPFEAAGSVAAELMPTWKLIPRLSSVVSKFMRDRAGSRPSFATYEFPGKADTLVVPLRLFRSIASEWKREHCSSGLESDGMAARWIRNEVLRGNGDSNCSPRAISVPLQDENYAT